MPGKKLSFQIFIDIKRLECAPRLRRGQPSRYCGAKSITMMKRHSAAPNGTSAGAERLADLVTLSYEPMFAWRLDGSIDGMSLLHNRSSITQFWRFAQMDGIVGRFRDVRSCINRPGRRDHNGRDISPPPAKTMKVYVP